jgi:hypothetical protein
MTKIAYSYLRFSTTEQAATPTRSRFFDDTQRNLRYINRAMADQPDYAVRAVHADEQAERAVSPALSDRWRGSQELPDAGASAHRDEISTPANASAECQGPEHLTARRVEADATLTPARSRAPVPALGRLRHHWTRMAANNGPYGSACSSL